jgi:hypothetical protein
VCAKTHNILEWQVCRWSISHFGLLPIVKTWGVARLMTFQNQKTLRSLRYVDTKKSKTWGVARLMNIPCSYFTLFTFNPGMNFKFITVYPPLIRQTPRGRPLIKCPFLAVTSKSAANHMP